MAHSLRRAALSALLLLPNLAAACSSCGCTLNSDWVSEGYTSGRGLRFDLRFDSFDQDELRNGRDRVSRGDLALPNDEEIQKRTDNRNTTLGIDYALSRSFAVNLQVPYFDRDHSTYAEGDTALSYSHSSGIGDVRLTGRWQGWSDDAGRGVMFGLKLPTGDTGVDFRSGPQAGEPLDRGLQPGTGTTDLLLGIYQVGALSPSIGYFAQATLQQPLAAHDHFRPGTGLNVNAGLRYLDWGRVTPQLQLNVRSERRESGADADVANSGATLVYLSPGLGVRFNRNWDGFAFVQFPVYQHVNGLQLEPRRFFSIGLQYRY